MEHRTLGRNGPKVSAIGLGCMSLSGIYGKSEDEAGIALVQHAIDSGIDLSRFLRHVWLGPQRGRCSAARSKGGATASSSLPSSARSRRRPAKVSMAGRSM